MIKHTFLGALAMIGSALALPTDPGAWFLPLAKTASRQPRARYAWFSSAAVPLASAPPPRARITTADPTYYEYDGRGNWVVLTPEQAQERATRATAHEIKVTDARRALRAGDTQRARALLVPLVRQNGADNSAVEALADACFRQGRYEEAFALIGPSIDERSQQGSLLRLALAGAMTRRVVAGQEEYCAGVIFQASAGLSAARTRPLSATDPQRVKAQALVAMASWHQMGGYDDDAIPFYLDALRLDPRDSWVQYSLGLIYARKNDPASARRFLSRATANAAGKLKALAEQNLSAIAPPAAKPKTSRGGTRG